MKELKYIDKKEKIKNLLHKEVKGFILIPLIITIIIFYVMDIDQRHYSLIIEFSYAILAFSIGIISVIKKYDDLEGVYIRIGIGCLILGIMQFIYVGFIHLNGLYLDIKHKDIVKLVIFFTNYIIIIFAFNIKTENMKAKFIYFRYISLIMVFVVAEFCVINAIYEFGITKGFLIVGWILLFVMTSYAVIFKSNSLKNNEKREIVFYLITIGICHAIYLWDDRLYFVEYIFKYLSIAVMYKILQNNLFYKSYEREKKIFEDTQKIGKELNKKLMSKNKKLKDLQSIIEKSEKRQSKLINEIRDAIIIISFDRISYINDIALKGMKINPDSENIIGMKVEVIHEMIKDRRVLEVEILNKIVSSMRQEFEEKELYKVINFKQGVSEYDVYFVRFNNVDRLLYVKDVTEIKSNEKLKGAYDKYLKEEELKDEFYSNISHELRTPINLIYSSIQMNEIYLKDKNIDGINKNNKTIKQNCLRLIRTINNFIDTNKISEGYLIPNKRNYNIVEIVENISLACKRYLDKIENNLIFDSEEEEIYAEVDKDMIDRVMLNLLSNSVKYGVYKSTIYINIGINKDKVIIKFRNELYTISDDVKPYLFDKFTKLNKSLNRDREGSGLGLFLAKALVELHNGTIEVESNKESGTEFILTIPRSDNQRFQEVHKEVEMNSVAAKVDTEFSDIYF